MCVFNLGLTYGLGAIGAQTGGTLPGTFMELAIVKSSPIFPEIIGIVIVILFAFILGFGATLAEPALNALGLTVQKLTNGAFKESMLMYSVATGVAVGIALGFSWSCIWIWRRFYYRSTVSALLRNLLNRGVRQCGLGQRQCMPGPLRSRSC